MGKISEALEKHKNEKIIKVENIFSSRKDATEEKDSYSSFLNNYDPKLLTYFEPNSVEAETFKLLSAQLLFPKNEQKKRLIMVTSTFPGEGKSFIASNLAVSIARGINEHVLLIDCDFRRPNLHKIMGCSNAEGLRDHLNGKKQLSDLMLKTTINKLTLLPAGKESTNPTELLASNKMRATLEEVKTRYSDRFIIVDAGPALATAEAEVLSNYVDTIIFVVMSGKTPREAIKKNIRRLGREKILGIFFNGYSESFKNYQKYYRGYDKPDD